MQKAQLQSVVYQIWPRSFKDSNGDGIGDIQGIIGKIPYLKSLGITTLWLSPIYASPNHDYGYDISDYYSVNPEFGTLEDFKLLVKSLKEAKIELLMDLVANHTSDQHPWFQAALHDPKSPYRAFYFFKEAYGNETPNNWMSLFGGSAWSKHEDGCYSLNLFTPQQKDLNWENPKVREAFYDVMKYWLDLGVSGFRMDVINMISKTPGLPSVGNSKKLVFAKEHFVSLKKSHEYLQEMYQKVLKDKEGLFIGEGVLINPESAALYSGFESSELDAMFHFDLALIGCGPLGKYDFRKGYRYTTLEFKTIYFDWQFASQEKGFGLGNFLSNHDQPRAVSRYGDDQKYHQESAKLLLTLNFVSKGTVFLYQGEEIGMTNLKLEVNEWKDYEAINDYEVLQSMMHLPAWLAKKVIQKMTRDHARTPMQWTDDVYAGFSSALPWIKVNPNTKDINVKAQEKDPYSILSYTKELIEMYKKYPTFAFGKIDAILKSHKQMIGIHRYDADHEFIILLNLSKKHATFKIEEQYLTAKMLMTNYPQGGSLVSKMIFRPYEARIYQVK